MKKRIVSALLAGFLLVSATACGKQTKAEALGFVETAIARICNYV